MYTPVYNNFLKIKELIFVNLPKNDKPEKQLYNQ